MYRTFWDRDGQPLSSQFPSAHGMAAAAATPVPAQNLLFQSPALASQSCGVRKSFAGDSWTSCGTGVRDQLRRTHQNVPQIQTTQAQSSGASREHRAGGQHLPGLQMGKDDTENQLNSSLAHGQFSQFKFSPWQEVSELPAPLSLYWWMEKHLGSFALLLIPPQNLHICLERSSKYSFQGNPSISKFLSLSSLQRPARPWSDPPWALVTLV